MGITTVSSSEFNLNLSRIKVAAKNGPILITDRGHPSYVLLTIQKYHKIDGKQENIVDLLAMPESQDIEFDPPRLKLHFI